MGRWDDEEKGHDRYRTGYGGGRRRISIRGIRRIIYVGFAILAIVMITFFVSRAGLHVALHERGDSMGTVQVITAQVSNNNFVTLNNVTIQFGNNNPVQIIGDMGPFASTLVSPEGDDYEFESVTVTANGGAVSVVKRR